MIESSDVKPFILDLKHRLMAIELTYAEAIFLIYFIVSRARIKEVK